MSSLTNFTKGIIKENPVFVMLLGLCPSLAVSTMAQNGLGMGIATTAVFLCSNLLISLLRNVIPETVRLPCYIVIISGFVTLVTILVRTFVPDLYNSLGIFLSLIAVNCIVFGRAEGFANKNKPWSSILDALGMGIGFTLALVMVGSVREILGAGKWFGREVGFDVLGVEPMMIFAFPAGGFFTLGILIAIINRLMKKEPREAGCDTCPGHSACKGLDIGAAKTVIESAQGEQKKQTKNQKEA
ncbi:MAG: electron transport complex subunit E [Oscillospiraceae bacterium]|nr:electron transport complex subunit E [Oscillospiraceae bacterium]